VRAPAGSQGGGGVQLPRCTLCLSLTTPYAENASRPRYDAGTYCENIHVVAEGCCKSWSEIVLVQQGAVAFIRQAGVVPHRSIRLVHPADLCSHITSFRRRADPYFNVLMRAAN